MSTIFDATDTTIRLRRRPRNDNSSHKKAARTIFGDTYEKELPIPTAIDEYNYNMGAVDIGDQLRASYTWEHRWRRGPWQPLSWGFLLGTVLVNCYKLQSQFGNWPDTTDGHFAWRNRLALQLFETFAPECRSRQRARPGIFLDVLNTAVPIPLHQRGQRGKRAVCKVCQALRHAAKKPLGERDPNLPLSASKTVSNVRGGCITCDVALCNSQTCWDMFHHTKIGVV